MIPLKETQLEALRLMHDGCVLRGDVGSGKSRTGLAYYYTQFGGDVHSKGYTKMVSPLDLYVITTARKRDTHDWELEFSPFRIGKDIYTNKVTVDSWNNINKYRDVKDAFFIFDEQRASGTGKWAKTFVRIARHNRWIMLSATPGDKWEHYISLFLANDFYPNLRAFKQEHLIYSPFCTAYPKVTGYRNKGKLERYRRLITVKMRKEKQHEKEKINENFIVGYDPFGYKDILKKRWNPYTDAPVVNAAELCQCLRRLVNSDISRVNAVLTILQYHEKAIIFYNYDYELYILRDLAYGPDTVVAEWNGHRHEPIPDCEQWVYLVQYTAGSEGWNCVQTDTIIFFSQNYSYRTMVQAAGRIDRMNSPYEILYYFHIKSDAPIDKAIDRALASKKDFNENDFVGKQKPYQPALPGIVPISGNKWENAVFNCTTGELTIPGAKI